MNESRASSASTPSSSAPWYVMRASFAVNVQLVSGRDQSPLWASRFARATAIELSASDDIATALARELGLAPPRVTSTAPLIPVAARDAYLRGRFYWNQRTPAGLHAAVDHLTRAIHDAPDFALAWAGLADVYASGGTVVSAAIAPWPGDPNTAGILAAERALQLDPTLGEAHAARGKLLMQLWRWADAERELAGAVRVSPNYATARQWYGTLLARLKKGDAAVEQVRIGSEIDPVTPIINEAVGSTFSMCGQPDRAAAAHRRVLEIHPAFATAHMLLGSSLYRLGKLTEAEASLRKALSLRPENCQIRARLAATLFTAPRRCSCACRRGRPRCSPGEGFVLLRGPGGGRRR
jgi:Tfp pilus assembly protein PilF